MEIIEDKAIVLRTRNPHKYKIIPKHKIVERMDGGYDVAVYWGLDEARVLRNLGVKDVPSPITSATTGRVVTNLWLTRSRQLRSLRCIAEHSCSLSPAQARRYLPSGRLIT